MEELATLLTGGQTVPQIVAFIYFTILGMIMIKLWRYNNKKKAGLRMTPPVFTQFHWPTWLNDNLLDFVLALMVSYTAFIFFPDTLSFLDKTNVLPVFGDKMLYGLVLGIMFQSITHRIFNNVKLINK